MLLTEKVKSILIELGKETDARSSYTVQLLSDMFYAHYEENLENHVPIEQFIKDHYKEAAELNKIN